MFFIFVIVLQLKISPSPGQVLRKIKENVFRAQNQKAKQHLLQHSVTGHQPTYRVKEGRIRQPLDHFDSQSTQTIPQVQRCMLHKYTSLFPYMWTGLKLIWCSHAQGQQNSLLDTFISRFMFYKEQAVTHWLALYSLTYPVLKDQILPPGSVYLDLRFNWYL